MNCVVCVRLYLPFASEVTTHSEAAMASSMSASVKVHINRR
jgi:hypothetical protein